MVNQGGEPFRFDPKLTPYTPGINDACDHPGVNLIAVKGNTRSGKALALDTPVPCPSGWTTMGAIAVGDEIFDERGQVCRVVFATEVQHGRDCYVVKFSEGSEIIADAEHLWRVQFMTGKHPKLRWDDVTLNTREMAPRVFKSTDRRKRFRVVNAEALDLPAKNLPIDPYVLGCWLGDGTSRSAQITLHEADWQIASDIEATGLRVDILHRTPTGVLTVRLGHQHEGPETCLRGHAFQEVGRFNDGSCKACRRLQWDCKKAGKPLPRHEGRFVDVLRQNRLLQNKHVPQDYLRGSRDQRLSLLQGLMDTDGTIAPAGAAVFTSTTRALADAVFELAASLGLKPTMASRDSNLHKDGVRIACARSFLVSFRAYADAPVFRLARKAARQPQREAGRVTDTGCRRIVSITSVASVPVRCIQVDSPSHLFLVGRAMIPTHNTVSAESMCLRDWTYGPLKNVLWFMQDEDSINDYIDERGEEMLRIHEEVNERIDWTDIRNGRKRRKIGKSLLLYRPATRRALRAKAAPTIVADEIDAYEKRIRKAIMTLITSRQEEFGSAAKAYLTSHPDEGPDDGIDAVLKDCLLHLWFVRCPHCGGASSPALEAEAWGAPRMTWNVPQLMARADEMERVAFLDWVAANVVLSCPHDGCHATFSPDERLALMAGGRWLQPQQKWHDDGEVEGVAMVAKQMGFVIHAFMSPFVKLAETARDWAAAKLTADTTGDTTKLKEVVCKKLGETFMGTKAEEQIEDWKTVQARLASNYAIKTVPAGVKFLTAFVDVQGDRFEVRVIGWDLALQSWLIDAYPIKQWPAMNGRSAFENIAPATRLSDWAVIEEAVLAASYPLASNPERASAGLPELYLPIARTVINAAGEPGVTNNARVWTANLLGRQPVEGRLIAPYRLLLMQGAASKKGEIYGKAKAIEYDDRQQKLRIQIYERYPNVHELKRIIAVRMKIAEPGPGKMNIPAGTPARTVRELVSERLVNGDWVKNNRFNETWDGWVACEVARATLRPERRELWANGALPEWAEPRPRGKIFETMIESPVSIFDRLAALNDGAD